MDPETRTRMVDANGAEWHFIRCQACGYPINLVTSEPNAEEHTMSNVRFCCVACMEVWKIGLVYAPTLGVLGTGKPA